jgi:hypothetical protein
MGEKMNAYRILVRKPERRRRRVDNIRQDGMDRIYLAQEHGNEPSVSIKCWEVLE